MAGRLARRARLGGQTGTIAFGIGVADVYPSSLLSVQGIGEALEPAWTEHMLVAAARLFV